MIVARERLRHQRGEIGQQSVNQTVHGTSRGTVAPLVNGVDCDYRPGGWLASCTRASVTRMRCSSVSLR